MGSTFFNLDNIWLWGGAIFFFILLVIVNWILFHDYKKSLKVGEKARLFNYCETTAFKVITTGLMIPIILALLGGIFNIGNVLAERIKNEEDQRIEKQWENVEETAKLWNEVFSLTSEVRYFQRGSDEETRIKDILKRMTNLCSTAADTVNEWAFRLELSENSTGPFVAFINILICSSSTVAYSILEGDGQEEVSELQNSLGVIQDQMNYIAHHSMLIILKNSVTIQGNISSSKEDEKKSEIEDQLGNMKIWLDGIREQQRAHNMILPAIISEEADAFREYADKLEEALRANKRDYVSEKEWEDFCNLFNKIPHEAFVNNRSIYYSKDYVRHLADWLGSRALYNEVLDRSKWPAPIAQ